MSKWKTGVEVKGRKKIRSLEKLNPTKIRMEKSSQTPNEDRKTDQGMDDSEKWVKSARNGEKNCHGGKDSKVRSDTKPQRREEHKGVENEKIKSTCRLVRRDNDERIQQSGFSQNFWQRGKAQKERKKKLGKPPHPPGNKKKTTRAK